MRADGWPPLTRAMVARSEEIAGFFRFSLKTARWLDLRETLRDWDGVGAEGYYAGGALVVDEAGG